MKIKFKNVCRAPLQDKKVGDVFRLEVTDQGIPVDAYWRRRLDEKAIEPVGQPIPTPEPVAAPAPEADPAPAPTATVARAARKQKD